jgi:L-fuculose-phosphate aldolase
MAATCAAGAAGRGASEGNTLKIQQLRALQELGRAVVETAQQMELSGLVEGTAGNVSCADESRSYVLITPTGVPYCELDATELPIVDLDGNLLAGSYLPSSELEMHLQVYRSREDVSSVVHTHSRFATTFAVLNRPIEAVHYMLAFAGPSVEVAPYRTYGTPELGEGCVDTLGGRNAVLLQNHGVIAVGTSAPKALNVAQVVEYTAELFWRAQCIGIPTILSGEEMARVGEKFDSYGQPQKAVEDGGDRA